MKTKVWTLIVVVALLSSLSSPIVEGTKFISYPVMDKNRVPKPKTPPNPANTLHRPCDAAEKCRTHAAATMSSSSNP